MQLGYYLGRVARGTAKAVLPVTKWAAQKATTFATDFGRGMVEQPTIITTGDEDRIEDTSDFEQKLDSVDEEIRRELHEEESVQPELPGMNPQQPVRES
tara:strand:- start:319 stop:615 length:297 start_codon:yes stop_codon:yes gene_type:complete